jgi:hypothetical protein
MPIERLEKTTIYKDRETGLNWRMRALEFDFLCIAFISLLTERIASHDERIMLYISIFIIIYFLPEIITGKSPGKWLIRISIRNKVGYPPLRIRLIFRYLIKTSWCILIAASYLANENIYFWFGILAGIILLYGHKYCIGKKPERALHDRLAGTMLRKDKDWVS